jgi:hypothetical protein
MESYLQYGAYSLVGIEERARGYSWARLQHVSGESINGHEALWVELRDDEDREFALRRYLNEQFGFTPKLAFESGQL